MLSKIREIQKLTGKSSLLAASQEIWRRGVGAVHSEDKVERLLAENEKLQQEHLEMARMVHDYETKLVNLERRIGEAERERKEFEWGYRGLFRENQWMKEELMKRRERKE